MTTQNIAVVPRPYVIYRHGQHNPPNTLYNSGTTSVYVSNDPQILPTDGFELTPQAMLPVPEDTYLSVACPTAGTVQLLDQEGTNFWDPASLANQLLVQGLPNQIATAINLIGVPPIDKAAELYYYMAPLPVGTTLLTPIIDASAYNSLMISVSETNGAAGSYTTARAMYVWYYADAAGTIPMSGDVYSYMPSGGKVLISPAANKGPYLQIYLGSRPGGAAVAIVEFEVIGSMRTTGPQPRVEIINQMGGAGFTTMSGDLGVWSATGAWPAGLSTEFPVTYGGPTTFGWNVGALANQSYMYIRDVQYGNIIWSLSFPVSATTQRGAMQVYLPLRAIQFDFTNSTPGAVTCTFALTMDGAR